MTLFWKKHTPHIVLNKLSLIFFMDRCQIQEENKIFDEAPYCDSI